MGQSERAITTMRTDCIYINYLHAIMKDDKRNNKFPNVQNDTQVVVFMK